MTKKDRIAIAERWTTAMSSSEVKPLNALASHRPLIHEAYSWGVGMATQRKPASRKDWPNNNESIAKMAEQIRAMKRIR